MIFIAHTHTKFHSQVAKSNFNQRTSILQDKALGIIAESSTTPAQGAADGSSRGSFLWG